MTINRRDFIKGTAVVGGAAALTGLAACTPSGSTVSWDQEYDVVIVGAGGAGLVAAITVQENDPDAKVVLFEKNSLPGGSSWLSGGNIGAMGTDNLKAYAVSQNNPIYRDDTFQMYWEDKLAAGCYYSDPAIARLFAFNSLDNFNWFEGLGMKYNGSRYYENPVNEPSDWSKASIMMSSQYLMTYTNGVSSMINRKFRYNVGGSYTDKEGTRLSGGNANVTCLLETLEKYPNAEIIVDTSVKTIVRENQISGDVQGVILEDGTAVRAKRAVILTAGGFAGNVEMMRLHDPRIREDMETSGNPGNTGDMIKAACLIGAQIVNMHCIQSDFGGSIKEPSMSGNNNSNPFSGPAAYIDVLKSTGKRFWTEKASDEQYMDAELMSLHKNGAGSWFRLGDKGSVASGRTPANLASFEANYGFVANTVAALATAIGCPAAALQQTINDYNTYVDSKKDTECGKPAIYLTHKITEPPFYAFEATYYCRTTPGGLRIDTNSQVVDVLGQPIPRLYAAGEQTGNVHGRFRNNGGDSWTDIICFGRISGKNAAALTPLS